MSRDPVFGSLPEIDPALLAAVEAAAAAAAAEGPAPEEDAVGAAAVAAAADSEEEESSSSSDEDDEKRLWREPRRPGESLVQRALRIHHELAALDAKAAAPKRAHDEDDELKTSVAEARAHLTGLERRNMGLGEELADCMRIFGERLELHKALLADLDDKRASLDGAMAKAQLKVTALERIEGGDADAEMRLSLAEARRALEHLMRQSEGLDQTVEARMGVFRARAASYQARRMRLEADRDALATEIRAAKAKVEALESALGDAPPAPKRARAEARAPAPRPDPPPPGPAPAALAAADSAAASADRAMERAAAALHRAPPPRFVLPTIVASPSRAPSQKGVKLYDAWPLLHCLTHMAHFDRPMSNDFVHGAVGVVASVVLHVRQLESKYWRVRSAAARTFAQRDLNGRAGKPPMAHLAPSVAGDSLLHRATLMANYFAAYQQFYRGPPEETAWRIRLARLVESAFAWRTAAGFVLAHADGAGDGRGAAKELAEALHGTIRDAASRPSVDAAFVGRLWAMVDAPSFEALDEVWGQYQNRRGGFSNCAPRRTAIAGTGYDEAGISLAALPSIVHVYLAALRDPTPAALAERARYEQLRTGLVFHPFHHNGHAHETDLEVQRVALRARLEAGEPMGDSESESDSD
jgi:hypothetical protein